MKRIVIVIIMAIFLLVSSLPAAAGDTKLKSTFDNAFYGGLTGALVGAAMLIFTEEPEDHLDYIAYGFGGGVILGAFYGVWRSSTGTASIEINDGKVAFNLPTPTAKITSIGTDKMVKLSADLLRYKW